MHRSTAWVIISATALISLLALGGVASFRFAVAPVYPALPVPDYGSQALIAASFMIANFIAAFCAGIYADRHAPDRRRIVGWTVVLLGASTVLGSILAFTLS